MKVPKDVRLVLKMLLFCIKLKQELFQKCLQIFSNGFCKISKVLHEWNFAETFVDRFRDSVGEYYYALPFASLTLSRLFGFVLSLILPHSHGNKWDDPPYLFPHNFGTSHEVTTYSFVCLPGVSFIHGHVILSRRVTTTAISTLYRFIEHIMYSSAFAI